MKHKAVLVLSLLSFLWAMTAPAVRAEEKAAPLTEGFRAEFLRQLDDVEKKVVGLAEATPQENYTWRPAEGVRSVSEVYLHLAGANFFFPRLMGIEPPTLIDRSMEASVTQKQKVIELLNESFEHARQSAVKTADDELEKTVKLFGRDATVREVFLLMATHMHEHLGQAIAYARVNGVVPPWTAARQARQPQSP